MKQGPGKVVCGVLPGPRQPSRDVFGTPENPRFTVMPEIEAAEKAVAAHKMPPAVPETLMKLPVLVGVPVTARKKGSDGTWWIKEPTPFSDKGRVIQGSFTAHYHDYVTEDPPGETPDKAEMEASRLLGLRRGPHPWQVG